jgi:PAS domain S-box-containing protein
MRGYCMHFYHDKLKQIRKQKRFSSEETAQKLGIHRTTYSSWERGKVIPSELKIRMLAKIFNVNVDVISDLIPDQAVSSVQLSTAVKDWMEIATGNKESVKQEISILFSGLTQLNRKLINTQLIVTALLSAVPSMFYVKDVNLKYITANELFLEKMSLNKHFNVFNKTDADFFPNKETALNNEEDQRVLTTGEQILDREGFIPGTRKTRWGLASKIPVYDSEGKIECVVGSFVDITDRKKEEKVREILETNINLMNDGVCIRSKKSLEYLYINKAYEDIYGYSLENFYDKFFWLNNCLHPDFKKKEMEYSRNSSWPKTSSFKIVRPNGEIRSIEAYFHEIELSGHIYYFFIDRDITEKIEKQKHINDFNNAITSSGDVIWIGDHGEIDKKLFKYSYISDNAEDLYGIEKYQLMSKPFLWLKHVHPLDRHRVIQWLKLEEYPKEVVYRSNIQKDKMCWINSRICKNNNVLYGVLSNVSIRKEKEFINKILEMTMHSVMDVIWVLNCNKKLVYYTGSPQGLYGRSFDNIKNPLQFWYDNILHIDSKDEYDKIADVELFNDSDKFLRKCKNKNGILTYPKTENFTYKAVKPDGTNIYIEAKTSYITYEEEIYSISVDREITNRYLHTVKLEKVKTFLANKNKLSESEVLQLKNICST